MSIFFSFFSRCRLRLFIPVFAACFALFLTACHDDDDDFNHVPPPGMGAMIVLNDTSDHMSVFIDGVRVADVREGKQGVYDLSPGVHRVVLDQQGGDHNFRGDIDILEGQLTILDVIIPSGGGTRYDVLIYFD